MITFLNFAPLNFAGGAERWMLDVSSSVNQSEAVVLMDVHASISSIYGKLVLKRAFDARITIDTKNKTKKHLSLTFTSFIPFTSQWRESRAALKDARLIYIRYELLETLLIIYFGGFSSVRKTIAGIHSPFIYQSPISLLDRIHNIVYCSLLSRWFLSQMKRIHVLNYYDQKMFTNKFQLKNIVHIPNYVVVREKYKKTIKTNNDTQLNIAFVGELNKRKGADILIETIKNASKDFIFHIAGDGLFKEEIEKLINNGNVKYYGYLSEEELSKLYDDCDILLSPSRAESFSLVCLDAMSHGLMLISSPETDLQLPTFIQKVNKERSPNGYIKLLKKVRQDTPTREMFAQKKTIHEYVHKNFSKNIVMPKLLKNVFSLPI